MLIVRKIQDLMVDISEYPHIPSDISLKQAMGIIKNSMLEARNCYRPMIALVFNGGKLVGTLRLRDILKGLEPNFLQPSSIAQGFAGDTTELSTIWELLFEKDSKELAERPVKEVMNPVKVFVSPDDPIVKAAYLMIRNDLLVLPVVADNKKLVGLARMMEIFDELSDSVLEKDPDADNIVEFKKSI